MTSSVSGFRHWHCCIDQRSICKLEDSPRAEFDKVSPTEKFANVYKLLPFEALSSHALGRFVEASGKGCFVGNENNAKNTNCFRRTTIGQIWHGKLGNCPLFCGTKVFVWVFVGVYLDVTEPFHRETLENVMKFKYTFFPALFLLASIRFLA